MAARVREGREGRRPHLDIFISRLLLGRGLELIIIRDVLGVRNPTNRHEAIILNFWKPGTVGDTAACAFIRHAYGNMYRAFTFVDTLGAAFNWKITFARTLRRFRAAVHRYGVSIKHFKAWRSHTTQKKHVPNSTLEQFKNLIDFDPVTYNFSLNGAFTAAISAASARLAHRARNTSVVTRTASTRYGMVMVLVSVAWTLSRPILLGAAAA